MSSVLEFINDLGNVVVLMLDDGSQETKTPETTPRTYSLLRPSAFSVSATTTSAGRLLQYR